MKRAFIIFGALLILSLAAGSVLIFSSKDQIISGYYEKKGVLAEESMDYKEAVRSYQKALKYNAGQMEARLGLCRVFMAQNDFESAEASYLDGIEQVSDSTAFYIGLSSALVMQNKYYEAAELLNNIKSDYVRIKIGSMRPRPPELTPMPGRYNKRIEVSLRNTGQSACFYTLGDNQEIKPYSGELSLESGSTVIWAVCVSENGLVSDIVTGEYTLDRIVERAYFVDPAVEAMARKSLNKPTGTFMTDELWGVKELSNLTDNGKILVNTVKSFQDLKYFPALQTLKLYCLKDEIPFDTMPQLTTLNALTLSECLLGGEVFAKIASLGIIRELDVSNNKIDELKGLSTLKNLEKLSLNGNNISNLKELASLKSLYYLDVGENAVSDLSALAQLEKLTWLSVEDNRISDLSPILLLSDLSFLDVSKNDLTDLRQLSKLKGLKGLSCKENEIEDLTPISGLDYLEVIDLSNNRIADIGALSRLEKLKSVNLSGNYIADISPLSGSVQITQLLISRNRLKDINPIKNLKKLILLDLQDNPIEDYTPVEECEELKTVFSDQPVNNGDDGALVSGAVKGIPKSGE